MPGRGSVKQGLRAALALANTAGLAALADVQDAGAAEVPSPQPARLTLGEPPGFGALTEQQTAVVDIYSGGRRLGEARITHSPGKVTFADPEKLVAMLPELANQRAVFAALSAPDLASNPALVCTASTNPAACGRLVPQVAGIIFDQDRFRIDVFVNPMLMTVREAVGRKYIQRPDSGLGIVNAIGVVMSGSSQGPRYTSVQNNLIIGDADRRVRAELSYATGFGVQADRLALEVDKPERRYMAGAFWAPGTDMIGRRKMLGLGIESQIDTRLDKDELWGNPLVVFLGQRARIDIVRDGRILSSRIYEAGNQQLDTRALPNGAYEVTLKIEEASGTRREEKRFFAKNQNIAAPGQNVFFAYAGVLLDERRRSFIAPTSTPFFQAGIARRLNPHLALDATVLATGRVAMGEVGGYYIGRTAQVRAAAVAASNGQWGGLLQVGTQGNSRLAFNFDLRHIEVARAVTTVLPEPEFGTIGPDAFTGAPDPAVPLARNSFSQVSGSISYSLPGARIAFDASYRKERGNRAAYSYGPSFRWEFLRKGQLRMSANGDLAVTSQGRSGYLGLNLQLTSARTSLNSSAGMRSSRAQGTGAAANINGNWQDSTFAGGELGLNAGYDHSTERDSLSSSAEFRSNTMSLRGDLAHSLGENSNPTQYSLGFQTSFAMRGGHIALKGKDQNDSMVIVKVDGAGPKDRFEVLVNDGAAGTVRGGSSAAVAVAGYRQYDIRLRQTQGDLLQVDGSPRRVGLYPGNVASLSWKARRITAMFGRLVLDSGAPVRLASLSNDTGIGETDDNGYFQIEGEIGGTIKVTMQGGQTCNVTLPQVQPQQGYAPLGTVTCRTAAQPLQLTSAAPKQFENIQE